MTMKDNFLVTLFTIMILIVFGFTYYILIDVNRAEIGKIDQQFWYLTAISIGLILFIILIFWASRRF